MQAARPPRYRPYDLAVHCGSHADHEKKHDAMRRFCEWYYRRRMEQLTRHILDPRSLRYLTLDLLFQFRRHAVMSAFHECDYDCERSAVVLDRVLDTPQPDWRDHLDELEGANVLARPVDDSFMFTVLNNGLHPTRNIHSSRYLPPGVRVQRALADMGRIVPWDSQTNPLRTGFPTSNISDALFRVIEAEEREFLLKEYIGGPILHVGHVERTQRALRKHMRLPPEMYRSPPFDVNDPVFCERLAANPIPGHFILLENRLEFITVSAFTFDEEDRNDGVFHQFNTPRMYPPESFHNEATIAGVFDHPSMAEAKAYTSGILKRRSMWKEGVRQYVEQNRPARRRGYRPTINRMKDYFKHDDHGVSTRHLQDKRTVNLVVWCPGVDFNSPLPAFRYSALAPRLDDFFRPIPSGFFTPDVPTRVHQWRGDMIRFLLPPPNPATMVPAGRRRPAQLHHTSAFPAPGATEGQWTTRGGMIQYTGRNNILQQFHWSQCWFPPGTAGAQLRSIPHRSWMLEIEGETANFVKQAAYERNAFAVRTYTRERQRAAEELGVDFLDPVLDQQLGHAPPTRDVMFIPQSMMLPTQFIVYAYVPFDAGTRHDVHLQDGRRALRVHRFAKRFRHIMVWTQLSYSERELEWQHGVYRDWVNDVHALNAIIHFRHRLMKQRPSRIQELELLERSGLGDQCREDTFWRSVLHPVRRETWQHIRNLSRCFDPYTVHPDFIAARPLPEGVEQIPHYRNARVDPGNVLNGREIFPSHRRPRRGIDHGPHVQALSRRVTRYEEEPVDSVERPGLYDGRHLLVGALHTPEVSKRLFEPHTPWWKNDSVHARYNRNSKREDAANSLPAKPVAPEVIDFCNSVAIMRDYHLDELRAMAVMYNVPLPPFIFFDKYRWDTWTPPGTELCAHCGLQCVITEISCIHLHNAAFIYPGYEDEYYPLVCPCSLFHPVQEPQALYAKEVFCSRLCFMRSEHRNPTNRFGGENPTGKRHQEFEAALSVPYLRGLPQEAIELINGHFTHKYDAGVYASEGVRVFDGPVPAPPKLIPRSDGDLDEVLWPEQPVVDQFGIPINTSVIPADLPVPTNTLPDRMWTWRLKPHGF